MLLVGINLFKNILTKNFYVEHGSESTSLGEFRIDDFKIDKNYIYNLLSEKTHKILYLMEIIQQYLMDLTL